MNQIWTKEDIARVIDAFGDTNDFINFNGVSFIKISMDSPDPLIQYLLPLCVMAGGACASGLVRSIIASSYEQFPSIGTKFILDNSEDNGKLVPTIHFLAPLLKEKNRPVLEFIIAHELAHILNGDIDPGNEAEQNTPVYRERERRADAFAIDLLGTNVGGLAYLTKMRDNLSDPNKIAEAGLPPDNAKLAVDQIQVRIDLMI